jgi:electron transfer flavoprotein beta subunit
LTGTTPREDTVSASGSRSYRLRPAAGDFRADDPGRRADHVLVLMEVGADVRVPPDRDPRSGRVRDEWLVREIDPASAAAFELALNLKASRPEVEVTAIHLGPADHEIWLRQLLARGADRVIRVWDEEFTGLRAAGKAVVLAAAAEAAGFDLVLAGAVGVLDAGGQLGVLLAAHLGVPCVTQAVDVTLTDSGAHTNVLHITRALDRGFRERVQTTLPAVATVSAGLSRGDAAPVAFSAAALLAAQTHEVPVWDLADLGVPRARVLRAEEALRHRPPGQPRPRLHPLAAPDPALPAFERILKLVQGSVKRREGRIVRRPAEGIVDEVFTTLKDEGWLDHLRSGKPAGE